MTSGKKVIDRLRADSADGVLRLSVDGGELQVSGTIRYELTVTSFDALTISGSGDATADFTGADNVTIDVDGSGSVDAEGVVAQALSLTIHGSGAEVFVTGALSGRLDGSGDVLYSGDPAVTKDISRSGDVDAP